MHKNWLNQGLSKMFVTNDLDIGNHNDSRVVFEEWLGLCDNPISDRFGRNHDYEQVAKHVREMSFISHAAMSSAGHVAYDCVSRSADRFDHLDDRHKQAAGG